MTFKRLISEDGVNVSLGRISFWILFGLSVYYWTILKTDVPRTLFDCLWIVMIYNFGKKGIRTAGTVFNKKDL